MFLQSKAALAESASVDHTACLGELTARDALKPAKAIAKDEKTSTGSRRRRDDRSAGPVVFYFTHFLIGLSIGTAFGTYMAILAAWAFSRQPDLLPNLWWVVLATALFLQVTFKAQMEAIRKTVFLRRKGNEVEGFRIRRRPEVILTVLKRAFLVLAAGCLVFTLVDYGAGRYRQALGAAAGPMFSPGLDVYFALYALATASIILACCELTLRLTQKAGFRYSAPVLFLAATAASGTCIYFVMSLVCPA